MRGIVIPIFDKYESIALANLQRIRTDFRVDLPLEVWEAGREISDGCRADLGRLGNITFRNVADHVGGWQDWRGYHIKAFAAKFTQFDEFLLCDADLTFVRDPTIIFSNLRYRRTGTFFFRDFHYWKFEKLSADSTDKLTSLTFFLGRREWLRKILPDRPRMFPFSWRYIYSDRVPRRPVAEAYMESGAVYLDRSRHADTIDTVFRLNNEGREETHRYTLGEKESWWIACCMCKKDFAMNVRYPAAKPRLTQFYGLREFYIQK